MSFNRIVIAAQRLNLNFVFRSILLFIICVYLVLAGGKFSGLVLFPLYYINTWLVALIGLAWVAWRLLRQHSFPSTRVDLPILFWLAAMLLSTVFSNDSRRSLEWFVYYLVCVLAFYLVVDLLRSGWPSSLFLNTLIISSLIILGLGVYEVANWYLSWFAIGGWSQLVPPSTIRIQATMGHANVLASYLNLLLPLGMAILILIRRRFLRMLLVGWILLVLGLLFLTSSRGGWLGTAAVLLSFSLFFYLDHRERTYSLWQTLLKHKAMVAVLIMVGLLTTGAIGLLLYRQVQNPSHVSGLGSRSYIWAVSLNEFRQNPLIGSGPGTYVSDFYRYYSIPPGMLLPHAHNFLINTLGEMGLLGLAAVMFIITRLFLSVLKSWRSQKEGKRTLLIGVIACLVGLTVHSQFEMPQIVPLVNLISCLAVALIVAPETVKVDYSRKLVLVKNGLLIFGYLFFIVVSGWWLRAYTVFEQGLQAVGQRDWTEASVYIDQAAQLDSRLAHYWFQAGYVHSKLAMVKNSAVLDKSELKIALNDMRRGLDIDDRYALNWANLAALRYDYGDRAGALEAMQRSVELAPSSYVMQTWLGSLFELTGKADQARAAFITALESEPDLVTTAFFKKNVLRQEITRNAPKLDAGWSALDAGDYAQAESIFHSRIGLNNSNAYLGLGLTLTRLNRYHEAEKALLIADFIDSGSFDTKMALSELYDLLGEKDKAAISRSEAENLQGPPLEFGAGWLENPEDLWIIYHRDAVKTE